MHTHTYTDTHAHTHTNTHTHTNPHVHTHTHTHTPTHTHDDSIRRNAMSCISPKNDTIYGRGAFCCAASYRSTTAGLWLLNHVYRNDILYYYWLVLAWLIVGYCQSSSFIVKSKRWLQYFSIKIIIIIIAQMTTWHDYVNNYSNIRNSHAKVVRPLTHPPSETNNFLCC